MRKSLLAAAGLAVVVAPVVLAAPRPDPSGLVLEGPEGVQHEVATVDDVVDFCQSSGTHGWELVDLATSIVNRMYTHYSCWHLWLTPSRSLREGHGNSNQYNLALAAVLRRLGLQIETVHASRVRMEHHPWYHTGHTWLRVTHDGRALDVCASRPGNRAGQVSFVPVTEVLSFGPRTYLDNALALAPFVVASTWKTWLTGRRVQRWVYRPFGETA